jgi:hypothetical protein
MTERRNIDLARRACIAKHTAFLSKHESDLSDHDLRAVKLRNMFLMAGGDPFEHSFYEGVTP